MGTLSGEVMLELPFLPPSSVGDLLLQERICCCSSKFFFVKVDSILVGIPQGRPKFFPFVKKKEENIKMWPFTLILKYEKKLGL